MPLDKNEIKELARKLGADMVGVGSAEAMDEAPVNHRPTDFLPNAKSIIAIAVRINYSAVDGLPLTRPEYVNDTNTARNKRNFIICELARKLEEEGFAAIPFGGGPFDTRALAGSLSLKHAAVVAGLGEFGLNNLFLSPKYGPRVLLAAIVTDAELEPDPPFNGKLCDLCEDCLKMCPADSLRNPQGYDRTKGWTIDKLSCYNYINEVLRPVYGDASCGMCIKACHVGKDKK